MQRTTPTVNFRQVKSDGDFNFWHVELYDESLMFPAGTAYVIANDHTGFAQLNFILVVDEWRNRGHGTGLVKAIQGRWPNLVATGPMGPPGEQLLRRCGLLYQDDEDF